MSTVTNARPATTPWIARTLGYPLSFAWNFTQGGVFSAAVSGGKTTGLLQGQMVGPAWLTGGAFGAEASLVALVVCAVAGLLLVIAAKRSGHVIQPFWSARNSVKSAA
jgi:hypothetical protein